MRINGKGDVNQLILFIDHGQDLQVKKMPVLSFENGHLKNYNLFQNTVSVSLTVEHGKISNGLPGCSDSF
jgi:hypothetical protein